MYAPPPPPLQVIINAHLVAAPGQADRLQEFLTTIQKHSLSDAEPGCLEYKTARSFVTDGGKPPRRSGRDWMYAQRILNSDQVLGVGGVCGRGGRGRTLPAAHRPETDRGGPGEPAGRATLCRM